MLLLYILYTLDTKILKNTLSSYAHINVNIKIVNIINIGQEVKSAFP